MSTSDEWSDIEQLFQLSLEQPVDKRHTFILETAANKDIAKSALKLLRAYELSTSFMSTSIDMGSLAPSYKAGDRIGNWQVERILGVGGMGEVYLVSRIGADFEQTGALKLIRIDDPVYASRFQKERQLLANLEHAGIGRLIDGGQGPDGRQYMVIEYVSGLPITEYVKSHNLDEAQKLHLFLLLCEALSYAHRQQILHRDIKPANVMVTDSAAVKLIDFGVAHVVNADDPSDTPITIAYAAPEQLQGRAVSAATDIYGLGLLLFELVTGKRYGAEKQAGFGNIHRDLRAIIEKCLQEHPQDRFHRVEDLIDDLKNYLATRPVKSRNGGIFYRIERFVSRQKHLTALAAIMVIAGLVLSALLEKDVISLRARFSKTPIVRTVLACDNTAITIKKNTVEYTGTPTPEVMKLIDAVRELQAKGDIVRVLAITPDCLGGVVIGDKYDFVDYKYDDPNWQYFKASVKSLRKKRSNINAIAFEPWQWSETRGFVIAHKTGIEAKGIVGPELQERMTSILHGVGSIKSVSFRPREDKFSGWSFAGQKGFTYTRNVTQDSGISYFPLIEELKNHGYIADYISFAPDMYQSFSFVFGNEDCEMANISTPRDHERCDFETITGKQLSDLKFPE